MIISSFASSVEDTPCPNISCKAPIHDQGLKGLLNEGGSKRRAVVEQLATEMGGNLEAFYFAFGSDDFVIIIDLPSDIDMTATAIVAQASGTVKSRVTVLVTPGGYGPSGAKKSQFSPAGVAEINIRLLRLSAESMLRAAGRSWDWRPSPNAS